MLELIPAIIPESLDDLSHKLARVAGIVPVVQIDFVDGVYASGARKSWPFVDVAGMSAFRRIGSEEDGMPFWDTFFFEVDLMMREPERMLEDVIAAGFGRVVIHMGSTTHVRDMIDRLRAFDVEVSLALELDDDPALLEPYVDAIDAIQCMGIAHIGMQGEASDMRVYERVSTLRAMYSDRIISVDGGVTLANAPLLVGAGADRLVSGSAIFGSDDIVKTVGDFLAVEDRTEELLS
jgi:ribulose-phosphate 3-epimerase